MMQNSKGCCCIVRFLLMSITVVAFSISSDLTAQTVSTWIGGDGNWSDSANWDNGVPEGVAVAIIEENAGEIIQDIDGLDLVGLEFRGSNANIVLQNPINVSQFMNWDAGKFSGDEFVALFGATEINGGRLDATIENFGDVVFGSHGQFVRIESEIGGTWNNRIGSTVDAPGGVLFGSFGVENPGEVNIFEGSTFTTTNGTLQSVWAVTNRGKIFQEGGFALFFGDYFQSEFAELILDSGGVDFFQVSDIEGLITGDGSVSNLNDPLGAVVVPGGDEIGQLVFAGALVMTPDTRLNFQIGPDLTSDRFLNLGGPLQLNGILNIEALPGATPGEYNLFSFNNASGLQVDDIQLGEVPDGFCGFLELNLFAQTVNLVVESLGDKFLQGDINGDGVVNLLDVAPFVALLANGQFQLEADINGDGAVNLLDVAGFVELLGN